MAKEPYKVVTSHTYVGLSLPKLTAIGANGLADTDRYGPSGLERISETCDTWA